VLLDIYMHSSSSWLTIKLLFPEFLLSVIS